MKCEECGDEFIANEGERGICSECVDWETDYDDENDRLLEQQEMADFEHCDEYYGVYGDNDLGDYGHDEY